jgi:hypothetical protein
MPGVGEPAVGLGFKHDLLGIGDLKPHWRTVIVEPAFQSESSAAPQ